ncbi:MAG: D-hexose-6-phosphate mutarotase [Neptuniibacter sp.]
MSKVTLQNFIEGLELGSYLIAWHGFPLGIEKHPWGELAYSLHGGQVVFFRPQGQKPILWLSEQLKSHPAAIRGGVPICWPWFAENPDDSSQPFHGVARTSEWIVTSQEFTPTEGHLTLKPAHDIYPGLSIQEDIIVDSQSISIRITTHNCSEEQKTITQALHTYLAVSGLENMEIRGLSGCRYVDKNLSGQTSTQEGELTISEATDRIYLNGSDTEIVDNAWGRSMIVQHTNSASTVVWNPGASAESMVDVGESQGNSFVCVETANTEAFDAVRLAPAASCFIETKISL